MDEKQLQRAITTANYILTMRPVLKTKALFADETENYVSPMESDPGQEVTFRFRTAARNVDLVYFVYGDQKVPMTLSQRSGSFDYYETRVVMPEEKFLYSFEVHNGSFVCYYNKLGVQNFYDPHHLFAVSPGFHTPDWAKGAVMYQIYIDRFCNGNPDNDVLDREYSYIHEPVNRVGNWNKRPAAMGVREFYGGDLEGVRQKLDYLQDLGVEVIYFNPLFVSPSNHKYDIQDYDHIDPHLGHFVVDEGDVLPEYGGENAQASRYKCRVTNWENLEATNQEFADLVSACHRRGIRVIMDGVFNHCGSFNKWMDRERIYENQPGYDPGAYVSSDSPYRSFFSFSNEQAWPYNPFYDGWWGHDTLPKLNYEGSKALEDYILKIAAKWVSPPYNVDGWRLDVAADLGHSSEYNHTFWKKFRQAVRSANPDAIILAEHYGDPASWLQGDEWDTVMNYDAFMEPLTWFFTGMEKHSDSSQDGLLGNADSFTNAMRYHMTSFLGPSLLVAMNELSNHDHSRFLTRTNRKVGRMDHFDYDAASDGVKPAVMREAVIMQMTWPGAPTVYYGDEAGVCGFTDPDNRRTYPWGHEDQGMLSFHKAAIAMHKRYGVLKYGSLIFLKKDYNILAYARFQEGMQAVVLFNNNETEQEICVNVRPAGIENGQCLTRVMLTDERGFTENKADYVVRGGDIIVKMPPCSSKVLIHDGSRD